MLRRVTSAGSNRCLGGSEGGGHRDKGRTKGLPLPYPAPRLEGRSQPYEPVLFPGLFCFGVETRTDPRPAPLNMGPAPALCAHPPALPPSPAGLRRTGRATRSAELTTEARLLEEILRNPSLESGARLVRHSPAAAERRWKGGVCLP